jgi:hypothetical protein
MPPSIVATHGGAAAVATALLQATSRLHVTLESALLARHFAPPFAFDDLPPTPPLQTSAEAVLGAAATGYPSPASPLEQARAATASTAATLARGAQLTRSRLRAAVTTSLTPRMDVYEESEAAALLTDALPPLTIDMANRPRVTRVLDLDWQAAKGRPAQPALPLTSHASAVALSAGAPPQRRSPLAIPVTPSASGRDPTERALRRRPRSARPNRTDGAYRPRAWPSAGRASRRSWRACAARLLVLEPRDAARAAAEWARARLAVTDIRLLPRAPPALPIRRLPHPITRAQPDEHERVCAAHHARSATSERPHVSSRPHVGRPHAASRDAAAATLLRRHAHGRACRRPFAEW